MKSRLVRITVVAAVFLAASEAFAGVTITSPTTTSNWTAGSMKTITFTFDRGCSGGKAKISGSGNDYWSTTFGVQNNPGSIMLQVPTTNAGSGNSESVTLDVEITQVDGKKATDSIVFTITNP